MVIYFDFLQESVMRRDSADDVGAAAAVASHTPAGEENQEINTDWVAVR